MILKSFTFATLAFKLPPTALCFGLFALALFAGLFIVPAQLHLTKNAFALHLLFQDPERLLDIIVSDVYANDGTSLLYNRFCLQPCLID